jgi:hypothetical protein
MGVMGWDGMRCDGMQRDGDGRRWDGSDLLEGVVFEVLKAEDVE